MFTRLIPSRAGDESMAIAASPLLCARTLMALISNGEEKNSIFFRKYTKNMYERLSSC